MAADHYCTLEDLNQLAPQAPFSTTSRPSAVAVTAWIDDIALEMDASLANVGYVVPVVGGPLALQLLRRISSYGALGLAQASRDTGVTTAVSASGKEVENIWSQKYTQRMKALTNPQDPFELPDAPRTSEQLEKQPENVLRSFVQGVTDDPSYDPTVAPEIQRYQVL